MSKQDEKIEMISQMIYGKIKEYEDAGLRYKNRESEIRKAGDSAFADLMWMRSKEQYNFANDLQSLLAKIDGMKEDN